VQHPCRAPASTLGNKRQGRGKTSWHSKPGVPPWCFGSPGSFLLHRATECVTLVRTRSFPAFRPPPTTKKKLPCSTARLARPLSGGCVESSCSEAVVSALRHVRQCQCVSSRSLRQLRLNGHLGEGSSLEICRLLAEPSLFAKPGVDCRGRAADVSQPSMRSAMSCMYPILLPCPRPWNAPFLSYRPPNFQSSPKQPPSSSRGAMAVSPCLCRQAALSPPVPCHHHAPLINTSTTCAGLDLVHLLYLPVIP
jgi:hypothetical protein